MNSKSRTTAPDFVYHRFKIKIDHTNYEVNKLDGTTEELFFGLSAGSWSQWIIGIIFTLVNIYISTSHYHEEHRAKILTRISRLVATNDEQGGTLIGVGLSVSAINVGLPTKVYFHGLSKHENILHRCGRSFLYQLSIHLLPTGFLICDQFPKGYDERVKSMAKVIQDGELEGKVRYESLGSIDDEYSFQFSSSELAATLISLAQDHQGKVQRMLRKDRTLKFDVLIVTFDGYSFPRTFLLGSNASEYQELKKACLSITKEKKPTD